MITSREEKIVPSGLPTEARENETVGETVVISSSNSWAALDLKSLWAYRELFYFLALRDIKVRYKQTFLGVTWVLLQPFATTLVFTVLFSRFGQTETLGVPYALFAFSGFVVWSFVNSAVTYSSNSLVNHTSLITKVYFPRLAVPTAAVAANLLDLLIGLLSLTAAMIFFAPVITWKIIFAPFFLVLILILTLGVGVLLSSLNVKYRDIKQLLPFALQLWLFVTPVFYSLRLLPENLRWFWKLNPMSGALEGFRSALFGQEFDLSAIAFSVVVTIAVCLFALFVFRRMEDDFADVI
ncbi:MAG TPA: ABC transporter permease [Pyrinomonadaceae bacterium]